MMLTGEAQKDQTPKPMITIGRILDGRASAEPSIAERPVAKTPNRNLGAVKSSQTLPGFAESALLPS